MPRVAIGYAEWALRDLEAIRTWYAEQGVPDVGDRFGEIVSRIEALREHPELGRIVLEFDQTFLRELIHPGPEAGTDRARLAQRTAACASGGRGEVRQ